MSLEINWDDQRAFLAVLDEGSLSAAARSLGVTQPTMRARIAALEQALGTKLFTRSVRGLTPTEQARALASAARAMARASDAFVRVASAPADEIAGTVRLSVSEAVGIEILPSMLKKLRILHPRIVVEISLSNQAADLLEQEVDIAVRMHPPAQDALIARKTGAIALGFFAHREYIARRGMPKNTEDLLDHAFIGPDRSQADLRFARTIIPNLKRENFVVRTDSHPTQLALARAGLGIAVAQRALCLADPRLVPVLPDVAIGALDTWIVAHEDLISAPRVRAVFNYLVEAFTLYARSGQDI